MMSARGSRPPAERNYPLAVGLLLTLSFGVLAVVGPLVAPHDPLARASLVFIDGQTLKPPFRPFQLADYPLGTDEIGRDMLSRLLWGIRPTLLLCVLIVVTRVVIGVPLGVLSGWYGGQLALLIARLTSVCLALPVLVIAVATIVLLGIERGLGPFIVGLTLTGWVNITTYVQQRTRQVRQAPYIESARAIGVSPRRLLWVHVAPQIWATLPLVLTFELSAVTLVLAELGYIGIFIGGGYVYTTAEDAVRVTSSYPELGQLLATFWTSLYRAPWVSVEAGGVVVLAIVGYSLLGEGLRRRLDVTRPRRPSWWRRQQPHRQRARQAAAVRMDFG